MTSTIKQIIAHLHADGTIGNETRRAWIAELERHEAVHQYDREQAVNEWKERAEKAEAAGAEKDAVLRFWRQRAHLLDDGRTWATAEKAKSEIDHALSLDCGKDYVPRAELEKVQAACAEMRQRLKNIVDDGACAEDWIEGECSWCLSKKLLESTDCGRGWLSPDKARKLREVLKHYATCSDGCTCGDGWSHEMAKEALALMEEGKKDDSK